ncbi:unnamed protein product [Cyprideis torosa]|uniref:Uncharacterized protein n=1 Tax=Cyprideis torosa TaxID=163714 RepID=A0A7R8W5A8_9CRUS|nr:unnamed protein product [Cyprideis torosa]CAG0879647.1 unnamed protein product [Cyprideis torosa]
MRCSIPPCGSPEWREFGTPSRAFTRALELLGSCRKNGITLRERAIPAVKERAGPAEKEKAIPAVKERAKPAVKERARPAVKERARPAVKERAKPAVKERARPAVKERARPAVKETVRPICEGKGKTSCEGKGKASCEGNDAVTKSAIFYFISTILLLFGELFCCFGHCTRRKRIFTFISGVVFIVSGLIMLIGLVIYISTFKGEVGGKLRSRSSFQPAMFSYRYGYSFLLVVAGFMGTEMSGTFAIFLYICWHQKYYERKENYRRQMSERFRRADGALTCISSGDFPPGTLVDPDCKVHSQLGRNGGGDFRPRTQSCNQLSYNQLSGNQLSGNHVDLGIPLVASCSRSVKSQHDLYPSMTTTAALHYLPSRMPNSVTMSTTADISAPEYSSTSPSASASRTSTLKRNQETNTENRPPMKKVKSVDRATNTLTDHSLDLHPLRQGFCSRSTSVDAPINTADSWKGSDRKITTIV